MNILKFFTFVAFLFLICHKGSAQPGGGGDPGGGQPVPIGSIEILISIGAGLGVKRILDVRRRKKQS